MKRIALLATLFGGLVAVTFWLAFNVWFWGLGGSQWVENEQRLPNADWQIMAGQGAARGQGLEISSPGPRGYALAALGLPEPLPREGLVGLRLEFSEPLGGASVSAGLGRGTNPYALTDVPVTWVDDTVAEVGARDFIGLPDEVELVALRMMRVGAADVRLVRAELLLEPPGFIGVQTLLWESFASREGWTQRSINHQIPDQRPFPFSAVYVVLVWWLASALLVLAWSLRDGQWRVGLAGAGGLFLAAWFFLDVAWQTTLWWRHAETVESFWGLSDVEKRMNEPDADNFAFVHSLTSRLDDPEVRILFFDPEIYYSARARYLAAPNPAYRSATPRPQPHGTYWSRLRSGDVMALLEGADAAVALSVPPGLRQAQGQPMTLNVADMADEGTEPFGEAGEKVLRPGRGWVIRSGWFDPPAVGPWRLEMDLGAVERSGWVDVRVRYRDSEDETGTLARRQFYARESEVRRFSLPLVARPGEELFVQVRTRGSPAARGAFVGGLSLQPMRLDDDAVWVSNAGRAPFYLARPLVSEQGGEAWLLY